MRLLITGLILALLVLGLWHIGRRPGCRAEPVRPRAAAPVEPAPSAFRRVLTPTAEEDLDPDRPGVFQPTAAGNVQSALYGSVRTTRSGSGLVASFHEGVDIAPVRRDTRGRPLDVVRAVADGTVAYVNRHAGNSDYGQYVVLMHADPLGEVYTLYAHLAAPAPGLRIGQTVAAGDALGVMGNTPPANIPLSRAHVHFEIGLVSNARFDRWFRGQKLLPDHGLYNGMNLQGLDPLGFFRAYGEAGSPFSFEGFLRTVPVAFETLAAWPALPDYFKRYPRLWQGTPYAGGAMVLSCSENGTLLRGRQASPDELRTAGGARYTVLSADEKVLGRNGFRLVSRQGGRWVVTPKGARYFDMVAY